MLRLPLPRYADRDPARPSAQVTVIEGETSVMVPANPVVGFAQGALPESVDF
jgi:hypothetical protein